jgi:hypothetical protein
MCSLYSLRSAIRQLCSFLWCQPSWLYLCILYAVHVVFSAVRNLTTIVAPWCTSIFLTLCMSLSLEPEVWHRLLPTPWLHQMNIVPSERCTAFVIVVISLNQYYLVYSCLQTGFGLDNWIYCSLYIHTTQDYRQYSAIAILHILQFTAAHSNRLCSLWSESDIHNLSGIRTHDPSARAGEDGSWTRPRGHGDRPVLLPVSLQWLL